MSYLIERLQLAVVLDAVSSDQIEFVQVPDRGCSGQSEWWLQDRVRLVR